jgi:predicted RNA-binding protein with RPS1 domain
VKDLMGAEAVREIRASKEVAETLKEKLGEFTFDDVLGELEKPGRDPREAFVPFAFRDDIFAVKDLEPAMVCPGIVTNITNFGAFVDIGVHQDGLVHISQLSNTFVKDPREVVSPGDRVTVKVLEVNKEKNQISLTMKTEAGARPARGERAKKGESVEGDSSSEGAKRGRRPRGGQGRGKPREEKPLVALTVKNPTLSINADGSISSPNRPAPRAPESLARSDRPRGDFHSRNDRGGDRGDRGDRGPSRGPREHRENFKNNPFATLAGLKNTLKTKD